MAVFPVCRFLLALVACCVLSQALPSARALPTSCRVQETGDGRTPLCLLALLPYPDAIPSLQPSWDAGPDLVPALELAVELINNDSDVLKDYILGLAHDDCGCDIYTKTTTSFTRSVLAAAQNQEHPIVGIIGPGCSTSTLTALPLSGRPEIALLTVHDAGSQLLEDRTLYPYGFSLLDTPYRGAESLFTLMRKNNWRRVVVLYEESRTYFRTTLQELETAGQVKFPRGAEISFSAGVSESHIPLGPIKSELLRVIVLFTGPSLTQQIMCLGYHRHNIRFPAYQWVLIGRSFSEVQSSVAFTYEGRRYSCSKELMLNTVLTGSLLMNYKLQPLNVTAPTTSGLSFVEYEQLYRERITTYNRNQDNPYVNISFNIWGTTVFDAVWALALAMDNANVNLSGYALGNPSITNLIRNEFPKLMFDGVSGKVTFDNATGFTKRIYDTYQVVDGNAVYVAYVEDSHLINVATTAVFIHDSFNEKPVTIHPAVAAVIVFFITVQLVLVVVAHILTIAYRKYHSVKASSPRLNQLIFIGVYMLLAAVYLYAIYRALPIDDEAVGQFCQVVWAWLFAPGFTLILGTIIVRTWRLYRIFTHFTNPGGLLLSEPALLVIVGLLLVPDVITATIWTAIDHFKVEITSEELVEVEGEQTFLQERSCTCDYYFYWFGIVFGYIAFLIIVTVTLSQLTRNILSRDFTTKTLRVLVYILAITVLLGGGLYYILAFSNANLYSDYVVLCIDVNVVIFLCTALVFFPPLLPLLKEKYGKVRASLSKAIEVKFTTVTHSSSEQPLSCSL